MAKSSAETIWGRRLQRGGMKCDLHQDTAQDCRTSRSPAAGRQIEVIKLKYQTRI
jgi:hypothetical protein